MNTSTVLRLKAYFTTEYSKVAGLPQGFEFNAELPTVDEAKAFAALFPKSTKMFGTTLSNLNGVRGWVVAYGNLVSNGVNGGVNETGLRRYRTIVKAADKLGIEIQYVASAGNSYATREAFEEAIS